MIRVRIPPSPTGLLHIGTARTALYNYLFARHEKGQIVFRSEDTDKERSKKEYEDDIVHGLNLLGITWDEGPYRQSERTENYKKYLKELLKKNTAYYCFCSKERLDKMREEQTAKKFPTRYDGACSTLDPKASAARVKAGESAVIRLRVIQDQELRFKDLIRGETVFSSKEFDDFVIARRLDDCLYNFTVVVDDHDMKITHVIRGEDHISNTPKQILIYRAFGWDIPEFAHLPLILNEDRTKMSKRKNKVSLNDYLAEGYLPEAIVNFLALVGWSHPEGKEILSMDELIVAFDLSRVHHGGAIFDIKKLDWINGEYIKKAIQEDVDGFFKKYFKFFEGKIPTQNTDLIKKILKDPDFEGRFKKLSDIASELRVFFEALPAYSPSLILNEKFKVTPEIAKTVFQKAIEAVRDIDWDVGDSAKTKVLSDAMMALVPALGLKNGQVLWPIRAALSGAERSPNFATLMVYLGKEETLKRLEFALGKL
ncbi:glutamate--tRNA ligase [Candidatus Peregrinibacteria bacterium]|nr:glutamate--tRNA ligase [Candidatus Peregrinibacteria bacterium]